MKQNRTMSPNRKKVMNCSESAVKIKAGSEIRGKGALRNKMFEKLKGARFRYLNEQLYLSKSKESPDVFRNDPFMYEAYHEGYRQQVSKWPINPLDIIIQELKNRVKKEKLVIADFGCGEALLAQKLKTAVVKSFDLVAVNDMVTACDMRHTNLSSCTVNIAVFCLSLMSSNVSECLKEANRVLKVGGVLKIAEVESRFDNIQTFINSFKSFGFKLVKKDFSQNMFWFLDFKKFRDISDKKNFPDILLKPCLYKKR